jgi:hypothetical protein
MNFPLRVLTGIAVGLGAYIFILGADKTGQISTIGLLTNPQQYAGRFDDAFGRFYMYWCMFLATIFGFFAFIALKKD